MSLVIFTIVSAIVFGIGDAFMIPLVMQPLFKAALGDQMLDQLRLWPAAGFYAIHLAGLVYFAGAPVSRGGPARMALLNGAMVGLIAYSCYEMTSYTIMKNWPIRLVVVDIAWGTAMSGIAAWAGALAAIKLMRG